MTNPEAQRFAEEWIEAFNRREIQKVLCHFVEECTFTSPQAFAITGKATLHSRSELTAYWTAAMESIRSLRFTLERTVNDPIANRVVILYVAEIDDRRTRAAEIYQFDESSRIVRGEAMYGAVA
jgi:hypothetical protein